MSEARLDPARSIIERFGIDKVAEITGKHVSSVHRWMYPKEKGGTGGFIPYPEVQMILQFARDNGIALSPAEFIEPSSAAAAASTPEAMA